MISEVSCACWLRIAFGSFLHDASFCLSLSLSLSLSRSKFLFLFSLPLQLFAFLCRQFSLGQLKKLFVKVCSNAKIARNANGISSTGVRGCMGVLFDTRHVAGTPEHGLSSKTPAQLVSGAYIQDIKS